MTAAAILERLQRAGLRLSERAGVLHAGPAASLTGDLRELIAANRGALLAEIERRRPAFVRELVKLFDGSVAEHSLLPQEAAHGSIGPDAARATP